MQCLLVAVGSKSGPNDNRVPLGNMYTLENEKTKVSCITTIISRIRIKGAVGRRKKNYYNIIHQSETSKKWHCYKRKIMV